MGQVQAYAVYGYLGNTGMKEEAQKGYEALVIHIIRYAVKDEVYALTRMSTDMDVLEFINSPLFAFYVAYVSPVDSTTMLTKFWEGVAMETLRQLHKSQDYQSIVKYLPDKVQDELGKRVFKRVLEREYA
jgi:hypothetical protein